MKKISIIIIVVILLIVGYFLFIKDSVGIETQTPINTSNSKLDMDAVCTSALAYMTFPDGTTADMFVQDCKEGKYPEVIENYKSQMNLDADVVI